MSEEICYKKNFLTSVIIRVDFPGQLPDLEKNLLTFKKKIQGEFPISESQKSIAQELKISPDEVKNQKTEFTLWVFRGANNDKKLTISPKAVFVEYHHYDSYKKVKLEFLEIMAAIYENYKNHICDRLGLRYINEIDLVDINENPFDWSSYLNDNLLGSLNFCPKKDILSRAFQNLEFNYNDYYLRFQYGMHNPDYPAVIKKKIFILDLDAYYQGPIGFEEISEALDKYHEKIQELFESSIKPDLRELMND